MLFPGSLTSKPSSVGGLQRGVPPGRTPQLFCYSWVTTLAMAVLAWLCATAGGFPTPLSAVESYKWYHISSGAKGGNGLIHTVGLKAWPHSALLEGCFPSTALARWWLAAVLGSLKGTPPQSPAWLARS